ncbi:MAG: Lpg1974 family pore-forming outer membrane protein [Parachlamydiales bacterium]
MKLCVYQICLLLLPSLLFSHNQKGDDFAHGFDSYEMNNEDHWIAQSEWDEEIVTPSAQVQSSGYNPAARPTVSHGYNVWVQGEGLYWKAAEEGITYALLIINPGPGNQPPKQFLVRQAKFDWNGGFRLSAGYLIPHGKWDLGIYWTRISSHGSKTIDRNTKPNHIVDIDQPIGYQNTMTGIITQVSGHWKIDLNQVDLQLGKEFGVSSHLTLRPIGGLRSAWIDQSVHANYALLSEVGSKHKIDWDFWGFGFLAGIEANWMLGRDWSIFSTADYSILWSFFEIDQKQTFNPARAYHFKKSFRCARGIYDIQLGLKWSHAFHRERWRLSVKGAYEYHLYTQQNQLLYNTNLVQTNPPANGSFVNNPGDLAYQGVSFSAQIDF